MDLEHEIRRRFGDAAERYATSPYHAAGFDLEEMLAAAEPRGDERALDVGCGAGHTALAFAPRVREVVALDLTPAMLEQTRALARERGLANLRVERGDAMALPFGDAEFDLVTCRQCAHHFARPEAAVREAARVLRPGGRFVLVDSVAPEDPAQDTFLNAIELLRDPSHVRDHGVSQWLAMLAQAGLEAECRGRWPLALEFHDWVARMRTPDVAVAQLRAMFEGATDGVRAGLALRAGERPAFELPIALFVARAPGGGR